tara:strand:+ start:8416 stop:9306 length:891 start_codon:yes stop_codon:yes gene_type:complete
MAYIPKSKINILNTPGGKFIVKSTNQEYIGDYIELSNGKYYVGNNPTNLNQELILPLSTDRLGISQNSYIYNNLKPEIVNFHSKNKFIYPSKTIPTSKDYNKGYYTRYFAKKVNEPRGYIEINVDVFNSISQQKREYDYYLYKVGSLTWNLKNGTRKANSINLQILERTFPFVSIIFPILNEFEIIDGILTTQGGELYYEDGREYTGPYHVHEGVPMVGAKHIEEPHATLYYREDLQNPNQEPQDYFNQSSSETQMQQMKNKTQNMAEVATTKSTSTTPQTSYSKQTPSFTGKGGY